MKKYFLLFCLCFFGISSFSQNAAHPTIDKVQVSYKAITTGSVSISNGRPDIKVMPEATVTLKATASKIYFKMMDAQNNLLYNVNYSLSSSAITNPQGVKLFYKEGNTVHIGDANTRSLMQYKYEVYTEDSQGNATPLFSVTQ
jgi:hypothetical protein